MLRLKEEIGMKKAKGLTFGSWLTQPDYAITEILAKSGYFDWLCVDLEHTVISLYQAQEMIRIIQLCGIEAYVRLSENNPVLIKKVLDAGANGIIVPMVNCAEDVYKAMEAVFYPPCGRRGVGLGRAQGYGVNFNEYRNKVQPKTKIIVQVEHIDAVNNIDEVLSIKGIFGYYVGPYDLSASLGRPGDFKCPKMLAALSKIKEAGRKYGVRAGYHVIEPNAAEVISKIKQGYTIIAVSLDMLILSRALESIFKKIKQ